MRTKHLTPYAIVSACFVLFLAMHVNAQEFRYKVQQDRLIGHRDGDLIFSTSNVEFRTKKEKESRVWTYTDIKLFEVLSATRVRIWTYRDSKLQLGKDESLTFKIIEGRLDQSVNNFLQDRIARPFVTSFIDPEETSLVQLPVKHSHRFGGCEGIIKVYSDKLVYESKSGQDSRSWRWTDIRAIGRPDIFRFEVETFEPQIGMSSRTFNFVLKEQMADQTYDLIWNRVFRPAPLIRVNERVSSR